jgi:hypothetical protein
MHNTTDSKDVQLSQSSKQWMLRTATYVFRLGWTVFACYYVGIDIHQELKFDTLSTHLSSGCFEHGEVSIKSISPSRFPPSVAWFQSIKARRVNNRRRTPLVVNLRTRAAYEKTPQADADSMVSAVHLACSRQGFASVLCINTEQPNWSLR